MLYNNASLTNSLELDSFPRIFTQEAVNSIEMIPIRKREFTEQYIVPLENSYQYMIENNMNFNDFIEELTETHMLDVDSLVYSLRPFTIYTNEDVKYLAASLKEEGYPVYLHTDPYSYEAQVIDQVCETCIANNTTEYFDAFAKYILNEDDYGIGASAQDGLTGLLNTMGDIVRHTGVGAAQDWLDKNVTDFADSKKTAYRFNSDTGKTETYQATVRNGAIMDKIKNNSIVKKLGLDNSDWFKNATGDMVNDIRNRGTTWATDKMQSFLGIDPNKPFNFGQVIDNIGQKISSVTSRMTGSSPQQQGILSALLNKLIALKNRLMKMMNGGR